MTVLALVTTGNATKNRNDPLSVMLPEVAKSQLVALATIIHSMIACVNPTLENESLKHHLHCHRKPPHQ